MCYCVKWWNRTVTRHLTFLIKKIYWQNSRRQQMSLSVTWICRVRCNLFETVRQSTKWPHSVRWRKPFLFWYNMYLFKIFHRRVCEWEQYFPFVENHFTLQCSALCSLIQLIHNNSCQIQFNQSQKCVYIYDNVHQNDVYWTLSSFHSEI